MPRLSLYRPEKSQDFKFIDRTVYEMFQVGGVDIYVHKYIGTEDADGIKKDARQIQDLLFLENRDRKYDQDIYTLRGHYQTSDIDFNLSQFGLFLSNDTLFVTVHINNSIDLMGRKIMAGDVFEMPNLKDEYAANDFASALKRFYVVEEINRAAEGFSATWYPHLYRIKLKSMVDSQEFKDILDKPADESTYAGEWNATTTYYPGQTVKYKGVIYEVQQEVVGNTDVTETTVEPIESDDWEDYYRVVYAGNWDPDENYYVGQTVKYNGILYEVQQNVVGNTVNSPDSTIEPTITNNWEDYYTISNAVTLRDVMSTYNRELAISNGVVAEAEIDAPKSGYDTSTFYTVAVDTSTGDVNLTLVTSGDNIAVDTLTNDTPKPLRNGYTGYLVDDGLPTNGSENNLPDEQFGFGIQFPLGAVTGDLFLRTDFLPNRLFRFDGKRWVKQEDAMRMNMTNNDTRQTQKTGFINNTAKSGIRQLASDTIKVDLSGDAEFTGGTITTAFTLSVSSALVTTNINYNKDYLVEAWLNDNGRATITSTENIGGKLAFTIGHSIYDGTRIDYRIYDVVVTQRQSLSKALRPEADN